MLDLTIGIGHLQLIDISIRRRFW